MAVVAVTIQNVTRETNANTTSDGGTWASIGGGVNVTADPDIVFEGANSITSKVSNKTDSGHDFTRSATQSVADRVWMIKIINTNYGSISGNGIRVSLGNSNTVNYEWQVIPTAADYPDGQNLGINKLGWWVFPIAESSTIDRTTNGSPSFTTWDYYRNIITNNAAAKSENLGSDAIDHCSQTDGGLILTGGDGASADGTFDDFVAYDDRTSSNRYGFALEYLGKFFAAGTWRVGSATATEFTSDSESVTWINSRSPAGWNRLYLDIQSASNAISITNGSIDSVGEATWATGAISTDTRPDLIVNNTLGSVDLTDTAFLNFRNLTLTSAVTINGCRFEAYDLTQSSADIDDCNFVTTAIDGTAFCNDFTNTLLTNSTFVKGVRVPDTNTPATGHAIEITGTGAVTFTGLSFTDYDVVSTFDTITGVDDVGEVITTDAAHGLESGQRVYYNKDGGTDSIGLTAHTTAYYVNVLTTTTLSLHTTLANAIADTSRVNLTDGSTGETHWLEPGSAAIYNSSGGSVDISVIGGTIPSIRNSSGSTTTATESVNLEINGVTEGSRCSMIGDGGAEDGVELLAGYADSTGKITGAFSGTTPQAVSVKARNSGIVADVQLYDASLTSYTDYTDEAREQVGADDVDLTPTPVQNGDIHYVGGLAQFGEILYNVTDISGTQTGVWEYWNGAWSSLTTTDNTNQFSNSGWNTVVFTPPSDWATTTVNSVGPFYYVRFRITALGLSSNPAAAEYITLNQTTKYKPFNGSGTILTSSGLTSTAVWIEDTIAN